MLPNTGEKVLRLLPAYGFIIILMVLSYLAYR